MLDLGLPGRLRAARAAARLNQRSVARVFGVTLNTIANWENGRSVPSITRIGRLATLYRVSTDWLLTGVAAMPHRM